MTSAIRRRLSAVLGAKKSPANISNLDSLSSVDSESPLVLPFSPSSTMQSFPEDLPPTSNELEARSKARLVVQSRKIGRIFGQVPASVDLTPRGTRRTLTRSASAAAPNPSRQSRHRKTATSASPLASPSDSTTSFLPPQSEGARTAKLAKLNRFLGEDVPPELVFPDLQNDPPMPRRARRRQSVDVTTFISPSPSLPDMKRSRSMAARAPRPHSSQESTDFQRRHDHNFGSLLTAKKRALNVKRARKMAQLFGEEPPKELVLSDTKRHADTNPPTPELSPTLSRFSLSSTASVSDLPEESRDDFQPSRSPVLVQPFDTLHDLAEPSTHFQNQHRRRVLKMAKLARFFGVAYQDISQSSPAQDLIIPVKTPLQVEIQVGGRRFWGLADKEGIHNADMPQVIDKLRALRAA